MVVGGGSNAAPLLFNLLIENLPLSSFGHSPPSYGLSIQHNPNESRVR